MHGLRHCAAMKPLSPQNVRAEPAGKGTVLMDRCAGHSLLKDHEGYLMVEKDGGGGAASMHLLFPLSRYQIALLAPPLVGVIGVLSSQGLRYISALFCASGIR